MTTMSTCFHSFLGQQLNDFIGYKRALGCRFDVEEKTLLLWDRFLITEGITSLDQVTTELVSSFLSSRPRKAPRSYNHLLCTVRRFLQWLVRQGFLVTCPAGQIKPKRQSYQRAPYIFDAGDARRLLGLASELKDNARAIKRGLTYRTMFAVLYGLGLRVGEVSRLCVGDVDFDRHLLVIRKTKFYKDRLVPYGPRLENLLKNYMTVKCAFPPARCSNDPLFSFSKDRHIRPETISQTFHALVPKLQLQIPAGTPSPRLHDLRHSFAVGTLLRWYRNGQNPGARLLHLSTFMGHVDPSSTALYLNATDNLLNEANRRFEAFARSCLEIGRKS